MRLNITDFLSSHWPTSQSSFLGACFTTVICSQSCSCFSHDAGPRPFMRNRVAFIQLVALSSGLFRKYSTLAAHARFRRQMFDGMDTGVLHRNTKLNVSLTKEQTAFLNQRRVSDFQRSFTVLPVIPHHWRQFVCRKLPAANRMLSYKIHAFQVIICAHDSAVAALGEWTERHYTLRIAWSVRPCRILGNQMVHASWHAPPCRGKGIDYKKEDILISRVHRETLKKKIKWNCTAFIPV